MKTREDTNQRQQQLMIGKVSKLLKQGKKPVDIANTLNCSILSVMYCIQCCRDAEENADDSAE